MITLSSVKICRRRSRTWKPHNDSTFSVKKTEIQEWRELNMPKASPGFSGGKLPGKSRAEEEEKKKKKKG